jgi:hypothetical protein
MPPIEKSKADPEASRKRNLELLLALFASDDAELSGFARSRLCRFSDAYAQDGTLIEGNQKK